MESGENRPVALVTGASSGIGEVFARKLAARGFQLILVARREDRLRKLATELGPQTQILVADLNIPEDVARVEEAIVTCDRFELLVNNAGFGSLGRFWTADLARQEEMHRVHVMATVRLTHGALRTMVPRNRGAVISVASVAGFGTAPGAVSYCATKAWINLFTEGLDMELRTQESAVQVQALCPGFTYSEFHDVVAVNRSTIPRWLWLETDYVVEYSLRALEKRQWLVIPDWKYQAGVMVLRHLPWFVRRRFVRGPKRV
jgi:short-subunit dehydrogenase